MFKILRESHEKNSYKDKIISHSIIPILHTFILRDNLLVHTLEAIMTIADEGTNP